MKIVNPAGSNPFFKLHREALLDEYLQQMLHQIGWRKRNFTIQLPLEKKDEWRCALEEALQKTSSSLRTKKRASAPNDEFPQFSELPAELRIQIWELAFDLDRFSQAAVHCIDERGGRFISNQPISSLLHTCHEARKIYLGHRFRKGVEFAFGTYIDFNVDTFYLINYERDEEKFDRFLESPSAYKIQNLAMRKSLACNIPMEGHMSEKQWEMKNLLNSWVELAVVFNDDRGSEEAWEDIGMRFQDLSAREKRKHAEISYARAYMKSLNSMMARCDTLETNYRFVRLVEEEVGS